MVVRGTRHVGAGCANKHVECGKHGRLLVSPSLPCGTRHASAGCGNACASVGCTDALAELLKHGRSLVSFPATWRATVILVLGGQSLGNMDFR